MEQNNNRNSQPSTNTTDPQNSIVNELLSQVALNGEPKKEQPDLVPPVGEPLKQDTQPRAEL